MAHYPPKRGFFPPEPYFQPSPGLPGLCPVRSPPERHRALWQPMPRPGRLRLLHKHSSCSHTFSKGHGASFTRAERGGSGWSTQLLFYPAAIPAALGRVAAPQVSTGAFLLHLAQPPRGRRAAGTALLPFFGGRQGRRKPARSSAALAGSRGATSCRVLLGTNLPPALRCGTGKPPSVSSFSQPTSSAAEIRSHTREMEEERAGSFGAHV